MFNCDKCHKTVNRYTSPIMKVIETREKAYPSIAIGDNKRRIDDDKQRIGDDKQSKCGYGYETVREIKLCPKCGERKVIGKEDDNGGEKGNNIQNRENEKRSRKRIMVK